MVQSPSSSRLRPPPSVRRIARLARKELRQLFRDPRTKRVIFAAPIIQLLAFGYAVNTDVRNVATVVVALIGALFYDEALTP